MDCKCKEVKKITLEADFGSDPIWCGVCGYNLDIEELEISEELRQAIFVWENQFGEWLDLDTDELEEDGEPLEEAFNARGLELLALLKQELGNKYEWNYSPSEMYK